MSGDLYGPPKGEANTGDEYKTLDDGEVGMDTSKEKGVSHVEDDEERHTAYDDVIGDILNPKEVMKARLKDMSQHNLITFN